MRRRGLATAGHRLATAIATFPLVDTLSGYPPGYAKRSWKLCVRPGRFISARKKVSTILAARTFQNILIKPDMTGLHTSITPRDAGRAGHRGEPH